MRAAIFSIAFAIVNTKEVSLDLTVGLGILFFIFLLLDSIEWAKNVFN